MQNDENQNPEVENTSTEETNDLSLLHDDNWSQLSKEDRKTHFESLNRTEAEEFFLNLTPADQYELIADLNHLQTRSWLRLLAPDDAADLIQEADADKKDEFLSLLDPQTKREVSALLAYAEDKAGGLMNSRFIRLRPNMNVDEAISYIRIQAKTQVETVYYSYVLDAEQHLVGVVSFRELFASASNKKVEEIMHTDVIQISVDMDQEHIGQVFSKYELMAIPVIDSNNKMVGIVTFDDIAQAVQEEATEDIHKIGAVETLDAPYLQISMTEMIKKRGGWLLILFVGEMFTASAMGYYEDILHRAVVLSMFLPLIISSGGNSGSQASTLIIRAMALGEVKLRDWWRVFIREIATGLCLGAALGLIGLLRIYFWPWREQIYGDHYGLLAVTVSASVIGVVLWGTISGSMLPFILRKFKLDPASASAPAVATIVDVTGVIIYFTVASMILKGTLL
ncbi:magnesium transporter [Pseudobdellovibrio exovorus]|uniref:Magnesium transporter MgtE n=1 Tax=Pseudobdellovibrio exovorus JSS TaxID=1184267 RepID=M4V7I0_9BACT|nr:magnesium transporter [Pseudobdellovibrio exovorus]AGH95163.1 Mg2+ transporter MgtE [Pseudobdellovibrio exovorus JSS]